MLHRALFGSLERFIGILIENYAGKLPFWLSTAQAVVCPIAEENNEYVKKLFKDLFKEGIKCEMDLRNEKINYKVREHSLAKVPFIIVCGKKEVAESTVTVRKLGSDKQEVMTREDLIKNMLASNKLPLN
jgi:threonyl-tRNA synthetase